MQVAGWAAEPPDGRRWPADGGVDGKRNGDAREFRPDRRLHLAVIAGAFLFVLWFSGLDRTADHQTYAVLFDGSVAGLSRGSAVQFIGIRVGEVTRSTLSPTIRGASRC